MQENMVKSVFIQIDAMYVCEHVDWATILSFRWVKLHVMPSSLRLITSFSIFFRLVNEGGDAVEAVTCSKSVFYWALKYQWQVRTEFNLFQLSVIMPAYAINQRLLPKSRKISTKWKQNQLWSAKENRENQYVSKINGDQ